MFLRFLERPATFRIICTSAVAWLLLVVFRIFVVSPDKPTVAALPAELLMAFGASYYDLLFVLAVAAISLALVSLSSASKWVAVAFEAAFYFVIAIVILWGFANTKLTKLLGEPFTYQWLQYSDFLQSVDVKSAVRDSINPRDMAYVVAILAAIGLGYRLGGRVSMRVRGTRPVVLASSLAITIATLVFLSGRCVEAMQLPAKKTANPIVHFVSSAFSETTPMLFTMQSSTKSDEFTGVPSSSNFVRATPNPIKNVLIFVLESTPAEYIQAYGGKYPVTPNIQRYSELSRKFDNVYAHIPAANFSLFSLYTSMYNDISPYGMTASHPKLPLTAISNVLSDNGFRTSFFWSSDLHYQSMDQFLKNKKLDVMRDFRDIRCDQPVFEVSTNEYPNADYAHDVCTATALSDWIDASPDKPFFAMMMTAMTHYPYVTNATPEHYVDDEKQNAYLNALRIGDEAFGVVMDRLAASGKLDSTLVVLLGDHGEAFGRHGNYVHASALYEENIHIPLMFFNRQLFGGDASQTLGGVIDVAPTVLDILGLPAPVTWQGRSLFSTKRPDRVYFFCPWNGYLFGYREGDRKVLFNASTGALEVYNLAHDEHEMKNLASEETEARPFLDPIAAWVQYQRGFIANAVAAAATLE